MLHVYKIILQVNICEERRKEWIRCNVDTILNSVSGSTNRGSMALSCQIDINIILCLYSFVRW